jgi:hypothetical protein
VGKFSPHFGGFHADLAWISMLNPAKPPKRGGQILPASQRKIGALINRLDQIREGWNRAS